MGDDQAGVTLPPNMTEEEVIEIVRELLGDDDMSDGELMSAYRSGMFQELCPDIAQYAKQKRPPNVEAAISPDVEVIPKPPAVKKEVICISDSDSGHESRHSHHKKKKKKKHKHHKDHKDRDRDQKDKDHHHKEHKDVKKEREENGGTSKAETSSAGHSSSKEVKRERDKSPERAIKKEKEVKRERDKTPDRSIKKEKDVKEPKPFSKYNSSQSHIRIRRWHPVLDREHGRHEKKLGLEPLSIVCLDLLDLPMLFHHPDKKGQNSNSRPLTSDLPLDQDKLDMIRRLERDKLNWFKGQLTRRALRHLKPNVKRERRLASSDEDTNSKKKKRVRIMTMSTSSSSGASSSGVMVPMKKPKVENDRKDRGGAKLSKAEREAEAKRRKLEEIRKKAHKVSKHGTRVLPWENKDEYFKGGKKKAEDLAREKAKAEKKKKAELKEKLEKQKKKNAPTVSFQRILAQIDAANKEEAKKPTVALKIPKISQRPAAEYKLERKINVGDVAKEVDRLLKSNVKVEMPVMPDNSEDLGEYTVKKIAWWVLKTEKEPPEFGVCHPELHDDDDMESNHSGDFDWPSDMSSIHGCVSDPEGLTSDLPPDPTKVNDPDWADDYCGEASLYGKMRYHKDVTNIESMDAFKSFLRIKPGTNYAKSNFEAKCFICNELCKGQRQLGAHIRSNSHKNNFRNYSLNMVSYEENIEKGVPQKVFAAKLVEYSVNQNSSNSEKPTDVSEAKRHHVGKIERARSDSPGPIIAGDTAANIQVHEMPIPDDISLPSIEDYDISSDESLQNVRVHIRTTGRWNEGLEKRWRTWRDEEAKIAEVYNVERERYINEPERHPAYEAEWMNFWEKRCAELEAEGKDTDNYDFQKEWMPFWLKRMQEIMKERVEGQVHELKQSHQIDKFSLRRLYNVPVEETRRKNVKKKVGKIQLENSSSFKSSAKVESSVPSHQPVAPPVSLQKHQSQYNRDNHHQHHSSSHNKRSNNNTHTRPADDRRDKYRSGGNREQFGRSSDAKQNLKIKDESNIRGTQALENISPSNSDIGDQPNHALKSIKSVCSNISSAEPPPPGEDKFSGPQNTFLSKAQINELRDKTSRDLNDLKFKHEHNRRADDKNTSNNRSSKSNKHLDRNDGGTNRRNDNCDKSKHSSDNRHGDDSNKSWKRRRDSENSTASDNVRMTHSSIQELREAISNEESISGSNAKSSGRPKIRTIEETSGKNLEDGEVASDISSLDDFNPGFKGVSTFINKSIPGLGEASISADNLDKNSLGYHLLERRKSVDQQGASHSERPKSEKDRPDSSKGHSSKDKNRHKQDYRGPPDARNIIRKNSQDSRSGDHHASRDNFHQNKKGNHNEKWNRRNKKKGNHHNQGFRNNNSNPSVFSNNSNRNAPPRIQEESWEPEESWETTTAENPWPPQRSTPQSPAVLNSAPTVPEWGNQIPVITASREPQAYNPGQPCQPNHHWQTPQQQWDSNYPPPATDPNNFYR